MEGWWGLVEGLRRDGGGMVGSGGGMEEGRWRDSDGMLEGRWRDGVGMVER